MNHIISLIILMFLINPKEIATDNSSYRLIWSDEFNQTNQKVNSKKWFMETKAPNNGKWYNNELQHYTDRIDNAYVSD